jgi:undecaprenyl diphosphate synthase
MSDVEQPESTEPTFASVPRHVAIIMDGNGRWAAARGLPRGEGHRRGVEALRKTIRAAGEMGIKFVTIFSFSAENWTRPPNEIHELMSLLRRFVRNDLVELHKSNVRVRVIGEREGLDPDIGRLLVEAEELTKKNTGLTLVVAFNYGARQELTRATRRIAEQVAHSTRTKSRIQISSFAQAESSACRISCSGSRLTANLCSCRHIGPISIERHWRLRSTSTSSASAGLAA